MAKEIRLNEDTLKEYYEKVEALNKLSLEVKEMSSDIKYTLKKIGSSYGKTCGKYVAYVETKLKLNEKFIQMLKNNNMLDRINKSCNMTDVSDILKTLTKQEFENYTDQWFEKLRVRKKWLIDKKYRSNTLSIIVVYM